ncbi:MAG TPA: ammonium transporter, partial [Methanomassiliicoccaceae archaeon]|nr:ammonium transporter [Methanomassiliicoccaceae archaeon]
MTALLPSDQVTWGMITCYMAGLGSIITTYLICQIVQKKVNPLIYTYAMLAGPVAIGSPLLSVNQWGALVVGLVAGAISALSFIYL